MKPLPCAFLQRAAVGGQGGVKAPDSEQIRPAPGTRRRLGGRLDGAADRLRGAESAVAGLANLLLDDFQRDWPTGEDISSTFVRDDIRGNGAARMGNPRWRRLTEERARTAKSVFHFDVHGVRV